MTVKERLEQQYQCPVWTTRTGEMIPMVKMTEYHLRCALSVAQTALAHLPDIRPLCAYPVPHGEVAKDEY